MVHGAALEKRKPLSYPVPPDTILCRLVGDSSSVCIWLYHPVLLGAKQYGGKMVAKLMPIKSSEGHSFAEILV